MEDNEIIELYKQRSQSAVPETDKKYGKFCRMIAGNILKNNSDTDECINDTYLNVWNAIPPQIPRVLAAFVGRIARNAALNMYEKRNRKKRSNGEADIVLSELQECVDMSGDIEAESDRRELEEALAEFLDSTNIIKRKMFVCRYWSLMSVKDVAKKLDVSESNVKVTLHRMREELKEFLRERGLY